MSSTAPGQAPVAAAAALGAVTTVAVALAPGLRFAYESLELHVALESAQGVVALLLCFLVFGRLRTSMQLRDLLLFVSFASFALTNLFVSALPVALEQETIGLTTWMAAGLRLAAVVTFAGAAVAPDRRLAPHGLVTRTTVLCAAVLTVVVTAAALADANLAQLIDPNLSPEASRTPLITGHALAIGIQVTATVGMTIAAVAFIARTARSGDDLFLWLAAGATLGTFARLNYVLFPSLYTEWFYTGDLLRAGSYLLFLVGGAREIGSYWRGQAEHAVLEERRRMARELHDGLTQELSFIRSQLASDAGLRPDMISFVSDAAERALVESRKAVETLSGSRDAESLGEALRSAADEVAAREEVDVVLEDDSDDDLLIDPAVHVALERIVREAVVNAVRHGAASLITVGVHATGSVVTVSVSDDGAGFDVRSKSSGRGFGLISMRERCEHVNGSFRVDSAPGRGTVVEVVVPAFT